jgi:hypothetical protein
VPVARHQLISFERHVFTDDQPAIAEVQFRMLPEDHAVMTGNITHSSQLLHRKIVTHVAISVKNSCLSSPR